MKTTQHAAMDKARRDFLKRVGTAATVAPAAALLLAAADKPAFAQVDPYGGANEIGSNVTGFTGSGSFTITGFEFEIGPPLP